MRIDLKNSTRRSAVLLAAGLILSACGSGGTSNPASTAPSMPATIARGALLQNPPPRVASLDAAALNTLLNTRGPVFTALAGAPKCGIDVHHFEYGTVGAGGESTTASGALLVPTGNDPACQGKRPLLVYGHGSSLQHKMNMAELNDLSNEGAGRVLLPAALFAAQGYIVVAPNYAGYDTSKLNYHPHHIADQNGKDLIDTLAATRAALPNLASPASENGKLFLTGYSEGGYVTMATHRALQLAGIAVTASVPMSGSYAESVPYENLATAGALGDLANVSLESRLQLLMQITAWQKANGALYETTDDVYTANYSKDIERLLPTDMDLNALVSSGKFPPYLLGNDAPGYASLSPAQQAAFGPPAQSLIKTSYLVPLLADIASKPCPVGDAAAPLNCAPTHKARLAWLKNDLRTWTPTAPMLMCGGHADPEVGFYNAQLSQAYFAAHGAHVPVLDVDSPLGDNDPYALPKKVYAQTRTLIMQAGGNPDSTENYHGGTVNLACHIAARDFFSRF